MWSNSNLLSMDTRPLRMLSGSEIVDRGRNVSDCILPEVGTKEVTPNGSWLQAKQIQSALEARKALVAGERIDKIGALSLAEWNDQEKLAEVTQQVGGHWQYMGNNINGTYFLLPEEALYLIETNCLVLKHNQVTVSLQKAYNLLLDDNMTLTKYKVYSSLSRLGYKVFRHDILKPGSIKTKKNATTNGNSTKLNADDCEMISTDKPHNGNCNKLTSLKPIDQPHNLMQDDTCLKSKESLPAASKLPSNDNDSNMELVIIDPLPDQTLNQSIDPIPMDEGSKIVLLHDNTDAVCGTGLAPTEFKVPSIDEHGVIRLGTKEVIVDVEMEAESSNTADFHTPKTNGDPLENTTQEKPMLNIYHSLEQKIKNRKIKHSDPKRCHDSFKNFPDCFKKEIIHINVPSEEYLPRNVFLNNTSYTLNVKDIRSKRRKSPEPTVKNKEQKNIRRSIRNCSEPKWLPTPNLPHFPPRTRFYPPPFGYPPHCRPNLFPYQRPHFPRHPFYPQPHPQMMYFPPTNSNPNNPPRLHKKPMNQRKIPHNMKSDHHQAIINFANRLKQFNIPPNNSLSSLIGLVARFNEIYKEKIRIAPNFDVVNDNQNFETIELDDDEVETNTPRVQSEKYDKYLTFVKALASKLNNLEIKKQSVAKQKKAFSNLLKHFNETFNAELELDAKGELIDKKLVVLDSSSDSDVVATDHIVQANKQRKRKVDNTETTNKKRKLLNPFNILNKVNEGASTSRSVNTDQEPVENIFRDLGKYLDKSWLPNNDDIGNATLCSKLDVLHLWSDSQPFYDFVSWVDLDCWVDLKLSFCSQMQAVSYFEQDLNAHSVFVTTENSRLKPILRPDSTDDWSNSLEKLRIIKTDTEVQETSLRIDFDVYNRDVQNFRKTDPPMPHFRVVCVDESSKFPTGAEARSVHARCDDNVTTVYAVVGTGSITYIQINPRDLPVYVGND